MLYEVITLHMGDSQVEGDRITSSLRERFQDRFGGSGPGLIIPNDPFRLNPSVTISNSSNWQLAYIYNAEQRVKGLSYGVLGGVAKVVHRITSYNVCYTKLLRAKAYSRKQVTENGEANAKRHSRFLRFDNPRAIF